MVTVIIEHRVKDFDRWLEAYHAHEPARTRTGCTSAHVHRDTKDPYDVFVTATWPSPEKARQFIEDPALPDVMRRAGVEGTPRIHMLDDVE